MPCYNEWDAYLEKGSKEYESRKAELEAKLKAVRHIIDYYYRVNRKPIPSVDFSGAEKVSGESVRGYFAFQDVSDSPPEEKPVLEAIMHHFACDQIHFTTLYDLVSLLDVKDPEEGGYARVMMLCANALRRSWWPE